jgi:hypothetical protein
MVKGAREEKHVLVKQRLELKSWQRWSHHEKLLPPSKVMQVRVAKTAVKGASP